MSKAIYPSKYTDRKVTDAQYLTDEIMERIARKEKKVLTYRYWNDPQWKKIFLRQLGEANKLLKEIDCVAIMAFLRSVKGRNIYSLGLRKLIIAGASQYDHSTTISVNPPEIKETDTLYIEFEDQEINVEMEYKKKGESLWEKLG